ncbi:MAG: MBOAT family O-acyltransferase, partial [Thermodesulfobacteriota bacterium]
VNIIDFWRRWHMTLSRFFRDYVYIPLGGSRSGRINEFSSLIITMLLGGLWHGAGWTFVFWGGLHGFYLAVNHGFRAFRSTYLGHDLKKSTALGRGAGRVLTFLAVVVSWVFFRAESFSSAGSILKGMAGLNGIALYANYKKKFSGLADTLASWGVEFTNFRLFEGDDAAIWLLCALLIVWFAPNTQQIMSGFSPALQDEKGRPVLTGGRIKWRPTLGWAVVTALISIVSILGLVRISEFLYFQF